MRDETLLHDLATSAYDVALQQKPWTPFLARLGDAFGATKTTLLSQDVRARTATVLGFTGFEGTAQQDYEAYYRLRNVFLLHGQRLMVPGLVRTNQMMCADAVLLASEYYNDFMCPNHARFTLGTTLARTPDTAVHLTVWRAPTQGEYQDEDCRALALLAPHLQRAMQVHERLAVAEQRVQGLETGLHHAMRGVALLDERGRAVFVNATLGAVISAGDGLRLASGELTATNRGSHRLFTAALADALRGGPGGTLPIRRVSGAAPYQVLVSPVPPTLQAPVTGRAAALVIVSDPLAPVQAEAVLLQASYDLTPTEALLAIRLADGLTVEAAADALRMSVSTARTHLKHVFLKTGVGRQAELVRLIVLGAVR